MRIRFFISILAILCLSNCGETSSAPSGCCDVPAIEATVGNGHVYVPNVFTPDGNGINDLLNVFGDSIAEIISMEVFDLNHRRVFKRVNFIPNDPSLGWDGTHHNYLLKGIFDIVIEVEAFDHTVKKIWGNACSYPCAREGNDPFSSADCQFPAQFYNGLFDPTLPSGEDGGCFE